MLHSPTLYPVRNAQPDYSFLSLAILLNFSVWPAKRANRERKIQRVEKTVRF